MAAFLASTQAGSVRIRRDALPLGVMVTQQALNLSSLGSNPRGASKVKAQH